MQAGRGTPLPTVPLFKGLTNQRQFLTVPSPIPIKEGHTMKKFLALFILGLMTTAFAAAAFANPCGVNSGKRLYNGRCV